MNGNTIQNMMKYNMMIARVRILLYILKMWQDGLRACLKTPVVEQSEAPGVYVFYLICLPGFPDILFILLIDSFFSICFHFQNHERHVIRQRSTVPPLLTNFHQVVNYLL